MFDFFYFSYFECCESLCERHDLLSTFYVLVILQSRFFFQLQKQHHHTDLPFAIIFLLGSTKWVTHFELDVP